MVGEESTEVIGERTGMCCGLFVLLSNKWLFNGGDGVTDLDSSNLVYLSFGAKLCPESDSDFVSL